MQHGICALRSTAFDRCYYCHLVLSEFCPSSLPHHRHRRRLPLAPGLYASSSLAARPPHGEYQPKKLRDSRAGLEFRTQERRSGAGRCYLRRALRTCCIEPAAGGRVREQALRRRGGATLRRFVSCRFMLLRASVNAGRAAALCGFSHYNTHLALLCAGVCPGSRPCALMRPTNAPRADAQAPSQATGECCWVQRRTQPERGAVGVFLLCRVPFAAGAW